MKKTLIIALIISSTFRKSATGGNSASGIIKPTITSDTSDNYIITKIKAIESYYLSFNCKKLI